MTSQKIEFQRTVDKEYHFFGEGLHSGAESLLVIKPAPSDHGITINGSAAIIQNAETSRLMTKVCGIMTVEHLLAYLWLRGITNAEIIVEGPEIPIMDGSCREYRVIGVLDQPAKAEFITLDPGKFYKNNSISILSSTGTSFKYTFFTGGISMSVDCFPGKEGHCNRLIDARTFCFEDQIPQMLNRGMIKGGNSTNAIILDRSWNPMNTTLRNTTEIADHKVLDMIGDFSLLGVRISGFRMASLGGTGHADNLEFVKYLANELKNTRRNK